MHLHRAVLATAVKARALVGSLFRFGEKPARHDGSCRGQEYGVGDHAMVRPHGPPLDVPRAPEDLELLHEGERAPSELGAQLGGLGDRREIGDEGPPGASAPSACSGARHGSGRSRRIRSRSRHRPAGQLAGLANFNGHGVRGGEGLGVGRIVALNGQNADARPCVPWGQPYSPNPTGSAELGNGLKTSTSKTSKSLTFRVTTIR